MAAAQSQNKPGMTRVAYKGFGDELWAQHSCLTRLVTTCDDKEITDCIKAAREKLAEAGKLADRRGTVR